MLRRFSLLAISLLMFGAACGDSDDLGSADVSEAPASTGGSGGDREGAINSALGGDFCDVARELTENDPTLGLSVLDGEEFFEAVDGIWSQVVPIVPAELSGDVQTITGQFAEMRQIAEQYDYDFTNPEFQAAMEALDTAASDAANENFDAYLENTCGVSRDSGTASVPTDRIIDIDPEDLENIDPAALAAAFGITPELAACLNDELGGLDPANIDPSMLNEEVCGTTLLEILSGLGGG